MIAAAAGKVILLGEHAVVHGHPALAAALDRGVRVSFERKPTGSTHLAVPHWDLAAVADDGSPVGQALARLSRAVGAGHLSVELRAIAELPPGAGLGSSAALMVACARALAAAAGRAPSPAEIEAAAQDGERVFHGNPSGVDVAIAARGGLGLFRRGAGLEPIAAAPLRLAIGLSGEPRRTAAVVERVQRALDERPAETGERLARLGQAAVEGAGALAAGDLARLGGLFDRAHGELAALGASTRGLDALCDAARRSGALGAKLTGAGGGGAAIALAPGRDDAVLAAWRALGCEAFVAEVGGGGADR